MLNFRYQLLRPNLPVIEAFNIAGFITVQCTPIHAAITPLLCTCIYDDVGVAVITVTGSGKHYLFLYQFAKWSNLDFFNYLCLQLGFFIIEIIDI